MKLTPHISLEPKLRVSRVPLPLSSRWHSALVNTSLTLVVCVLVVTGPEEKCIIQEAEVPLSV
jgi:hypothetical protein